MLKTVKLEKKDKIAILTISRPEALNALNAQVIGDLEEAVAMIEKDSDAAALIITGEGRSFVAGADIGEQAVLDLEGGRDWGRRGSALMRRIELLQIPTIAAVNGYALGGGCDLALACDIIIAGKKAKFGQPEVGLGITPGFSGTQRLPRRVGIGKAKDLIFTGARINAAEALNIGLANKVTEQEDLMAEAEAMAQAITKNAPLAVKYSKAAIARGMEVDIDAGIAIENELFAMCFASRDQKEGMQAFLEKRPASFENK